VHDWPDLVAVCHEGHQDEPIRHDDCAHDQLAAQCIIREQTGKLKGVAQGVASLAKILAGNFTEEDE
jgi:hypothetical protein